VVVVEAREVIGLAVQSAAQRAAKSTEPTERDQGMSLVSQKSALGARAEGHKPA
jgi:hypothetical protein